MTLNELWEKFLANHAEIYTCSSALKDTKRIYAKHFSKWGNRSISSFTRFEIESLFIKTGKARGIYADNEPFLCHRVLFYTLLYTGQRRRNVLAMRWEHVDFTSNVWYIPKTKNGTSMRVPLVEQLAVMLKELKLESGSCSDWVFSTRGIPKNTSANQAKSGGALKPARTYKIYAYTTCGARSEAMNVWAEWICPLSAKRWIIKYWRRRKSMRASTFPPSAKPCNKRSTCSRGLENKLSEADFSEKNVALIFCQGGFFISKKIIFLCERLWTVCHRPFGQ